MSLSVEFLGTAGYLPIPRPLCECNVCRQARELGPPYSRSGPSLFVHGANVLIDTPGEIVDQLNRSSVERIDACFYSHWHPDHTMGRHVFSLMNSGYPSWPYKPRRTTLIYLPQEVAVTARSHLGIRDHLDEMEREEQVVEVRELRDGETVQVNETVITPFRLHESFVYGFLFENENERLLVVADEMHDWEPPEDVRGVDLAVLPFGVAEFHPLTGERLISEDHIALTLEATFEDTLRIIQTLDAKHVAITHIEESEGLTHDDLSQLAERLNDQGFNVTFAHDTQVIEM